MLKVSLKTIDRTTTKKEWKQITRGLRIVDDIVSLKVEKSLAASMSHYLMYGTFAKIKPAEGM